MTISKVKLPDNSEHYLKAKYLESTPTSEAESVEFYTRTTTEDATVATIQKIYGNTIKWNQLLVNGNFDGLTGWTAYMSATATVSNNVVTVTKSDSSSGLGGILYTATTGNTSHKYYIAGSLCTNTSGVSIFLGFQTTSYTVGGNSYLEGTTSSFQRLSMVTSPKNSTDKITIRVGTGAAAVGSSGQAKELICVDLTDLYGSGNEPTAAQFEAQYPEPYYAYYPLNLSSLRATSIQAKDSNSNVIGSSTLNITSLTGKLNGTGSSVAIFSDAVSSGMKLNRAVYDECTSTRAIKRVKAVDLGTLSWTYRAADQYSTVPLFRGTLGGDRKRNSSNFTCALYTTVDSRGDLATSDKTISVWNTSSDYICIRDDSYSYAPTFKSAMDGVLLYYEITTPEEYILDNPIQSEYQVVTGGTESIVPSDPSLSAPIKMDVIYGNAADTLNNLPQTYISVDSLKDFLSALGTQMGGTWSMQYTNGKYTFTYITK